MYFAVSRCYIAAWHYVTLFFYTGLMPVLLKRINYLTNMYLIFLPQTKFYSSQSSMPQSKSDIELTYSKIFNFT